MADENSETIADLIKTFSDISNSGLRVSAVTREMDRAFRKSVKEIGFFNTIMRGSDRTMGNWQNRIKLSNNYIKEEYGQRRLLTSVLIRSMTGMSKGLFQGTGKLTDFNSAIDSTIGQIPFVGKTLAFGAKEALNSAEGWVNTYVQLASQGADFGASLVKMKNSALDSNLMLDQFAGIVSNNADMLQRLGGSLRAGSLELSKYSKGLGDSRDKIFNLGILYDEQLELISDNLEMRTRDQRFLRLSHNEQIKANKEYILQIDMLAKLTGKNRKELSNSMVELARDGKFQAAIQDYTNQRVRNAGGSLRDMVEQIKNTFPGFEDLTKDIITVGVATTDSTRALSSMNPAMVEMIEQAKKVSLMDISDSERQRKRQILLDKYAPQIIKNNKELASVTRLAGASSSNALNAQAEVTVGLFNLGGRIANMTKKGGAGSFLTLWETTKRLQEAQMESAKSSDEAIKKGLDPLLISILDVKKGFIGMQIAAQTVLFNNFAEAMKTTQGSLNKFSIMIDEASEAARRSSELDPLSEQIEKLGKAIIGYDDSVEKAKKDFLADDFFGLLKHNLDDSVLVKFLKNMGFAAWNPVDIVVLFGKVMSEGLSKSKVKQPPAQRPTTGTPTDSIIGLGNRAIDTQAEGGLVIGGKSYIVGERQPELFTPTTNGQIIPDFKSAIQKISDSAKTIKSGNQSINITPGQMDKVTAQNISDIKDEIKNTQEGPILKTTTSMASDISDIKNSINSLVGVASKGNQNTADIARLQSQLARLLA